MGGEQFLVTVSAELIEDTAMGNQVALLRPCNTARPVFQSFKDQQDFFRRADRHGGVTIRNFGKRPADPGFQHLFDNA